MEIATIVGLGLIGNYFNENYKNRKQKTLMNETRNQKRQELPPNETPMDTIIDSIRTDELLRAEKKRIINDYDFTYAQRRSGTTTTMDYKPMNRIMSDTTLNYSGIQPSGVDVLSTQEVVGGTQQQKEDTNKNKTIESFADLTAPAQKGNGNDSNQEQISSLTGLPVEKTHENMVPFFGGSIKQPKSYSNRIINTFTGAYDLKGPKKTIRRFFPLQPQNIYGTPNLPYEYREKRVLSNLSDKVNGYAPEGTRDYIGAPYPEQIPRIHERTVNQRRTKTNPKINIFGRDTGPAESLIKERSSIGNYKKNGAPKTFSKGEARYGAAYNSYNQDGQEENREGIFYDNTQYDVKVQDRVHNNYVIEDLHGPAGPTGPQGSITRYGQQTEVDHESMYNNNPKFLRY